VTATEPTDIVKLRTELTQAARAHHRRAMVAVAAVSELEKEEDAPPWLYDAWRGSSMAALYGETLAAVLGHIEADCPPDIAADIHSLAFHMLENGAEDENSDVADA
jgi:hypothetical protein